MIPKTVDARIYAKKQDPRRAVGDGLLETGQRLFGAAERGEDVAGVLCEHEAIGSRGAWQSLKDGQCLIPFPGGGVDSPQFRE